MDTLLRICGCAMLALVALVLVRTVRPEFTFPLRLAAAVVVFGAAFVLTGPVIDYLKSLADGLGLPENSEILFRALAAAILTQLCSGICRENGETTLASGIELAGRGTVLVLCLPLLKGIFSLAEELVA